MFSSELSYDAAAFQPYGISVCRHHLFCFAKASFFGLKLLILFVIVYKIPPVFNIFFQFYINFPIIMKAGGSLYSFSALPPAF